MKDLIEQIVKEFEKSWDNPTWGKRHDPTIPAFYNLPAEEGDEESWDTIKIKAFIRSSLEKAYEAGQEAEAVATTLKANEGTQEQAIQSQ